MQKATQKNLLFEMLKIRLLELRIAETYKEQEMRCPVHLSVGQEAIPVGLSAHLTKHDKVFSNHRSHGHYLAKGGNMPAMLAEIYSKQTGCTKGVGGSMHLIDTQAGFMGATPIVASSIPIATGAAFAAKLKKQDHIIISYLGDAATEEGVFSESLDFAALHELPIIFVVENNLYSVYSSLEIRQSKKRNLQAIASSHGIKAAKGNGNDVKEVYHLSEIAVASARANSPYLLEFDTYRWLEHCGPNYDNDIGYRSEKEFLAWQKTCPINHLKAQILADKIISPEEIEKQEAKIKQEIDEAFSFAKQSPFPTPDSAFENVYAKTKEDEQSTNNEATKLKFNELKFSEAVLEANDLCLKNFDDCFLMGLGVPDPKGLFATTLGLQEKYGSSRVMDMPTAENAMTGVAVGAAISGMRPILTHQRLDFALLSMDQIVNQAAKWRYMFGGLSNVPLVIRMIIGRGWGQGPQHSQSLHSWFAHIPGLKVVMPSTPNDAKALLIASVADDDPVIFLEHRWLHNIKGQVAKGFGIEPLGKAKVIIEGSEISIVAASYMTLEAYRAAKILDTLGVKAEVIDLRTIKPLDMKTVLASVSKTGRLLVADIGHTNFGIAGEIITSVCEQAFDKLKCPPQRICMPDVPMPTARTMANSLYPQAIDIARQILKMLEKSEKEISETKNTHPLDIPDPEFTGPF